MKKIILYGLGKKGIEYAEDVTHAYEYYYDQIDRIIQPVEEVGRIAGEQILNRVEKPESPILERVLASFYRPWSEESPPFKHNLS